MFIKAIKYSYFFLSLFLLLSSSCNQDEYREETIMVASETITDIEQSGLAEREYLLIKSTESDKWIYLSSTIKGFDYEKGYEYILKVGITTIKKPVEDQYPKSYTLIEIISKIKKQSTNLPI